MKINSSFLTIRNFNITYHHLLIIFILSLSFSVSFLLRTIPSFYGWELNEYDPFFNYRATEFLINNGINEYHNWNDGLSWYPNGRDVYATSQVILHFTTAFLYNFVSSDYTLYDFTIIFPAIIGSLTTIAIFLLVRLFAGTSAGLFASLLFAFSIPILLRGMIGWFKSEPLGLFFSIFSIYLLLSGLQKNNSKFNIIKLSSAGLLFTLGISAWGGNQFFIIPISIYVFSLIFTRDDKKEIIKKISVFILSFMSLLLVFERPGINFISSFSGILLLSSFLFLILISLIQYKSTKKNKTKNSLLALIIIFTSSIILLSLLANSDLLPEPTHRYLNAVNPFLTTSDPLVDSISEHSTTTLQTSFFFHGSLMIFASIGIWYIFKNFSNYIKKDLIIFVLILGILGVYVSSTFSRLELFSSISLIILSSITLSEIFNNLFHKNILRKKSKIVNISLPLIVIFIIVFPLITSNSNGIFTTLDTPPTILNGGTNMKISTNDWNESLEWIKNNTPEDAVIGSWWDYGYWIQTKGERATLADNSTLNTEVIQKIAKILFSEPLDGWKQLRNMETDYFVIFVSGQRLEVNGLQNQALYTLGAGGDESKKFWFIKIADEPLEKFLYSDNFTATDELWNHTLFGKLIPFQIVGYYNPTSGEQYSTFVHGTLPIYEKNIKFDTDDPFELVYSSPSFETNPGQPLIGVFIYKINYEYVEN